MSYSTITNELLDELLAAVALGDVDSVPVLEDAILEYRPAKKSARYTCIEWPSITRNGLVHPARREPRAFAVITPGRSIRMVGISERYAITPELLARYGGGAYLAGYDRSFDVGDQAEYDSYNLSYYGPIHAIGEKSVTINDPDGRGAKRLTIASFWSRNRDFDLASTARKNAEEMMCL